MFEVLATNQAAIANQILSENLGIAENTLAPWRRRRANSFRVSITSIGLHSLHFIIWYAPSRIILRARFFIVTKIA
jgi:hypothetical protein